MPRYLLPVLILAAVVLAAGLTWWTLMRPASAGDVATVEQDVAPFRRLELDGAADVTLRQGTTEHLSVQALARGLSVVANVEGDTLTVDAHDTRRWWQSLFGGARANRTARITITFRNLEAVTISGAVNVAAAAFDTPELVVEASGGSTLRIDALKTRLLHVQADGALKARLAGTATEQRISISGAGDYNAADLASQIASVDVSGVGTVVLRVEKTLSASISGAGSVEYYGNPQVRQSISGVGKVRQREAAEVLPPEGLRKVAEAANGRVAVR
jgi:hypothetical protein